MHLSHENLLSYPSVILLFNYLNIRLNKKNFDKKPLICGVFLSYSYSNITFRGV